MSPVGTTDDRNSELTRAIGTVLEQLTEKPLHFCKGFSVQVQMERKRRFELPTLSLARRCSTTELLPLVDSTVSITNRTVKSGSAITAVIGMREDSL